MLVLVLLGGNRHARRGQSRLLVCQTEEDVGVTAGMHHLRSLHRRRSVSTSILVLIPFPSPLLLLLAKFVLVLVDQRRTSEHLADGLEDGLLHRARVRVGTSTTIVVIRAGGGGGGAGGVRLKVGGV